MSLFDWLFWISLFLGVLLISIRNRWVYTKRIDVLNRSTEAFYSLPSYTHMMCRFWVWDIDRFLEAHWRAAIKQARSELRDRPPGRW